MGRLAGKMAVIVGATLAIDQATSFVNGVTLFAHGGAAQV